MIKLIHYSYTIIFSFICIISIHSYGNDLVTIQSLDLDRYSGTWYEIGRLPNFFERGLTCITTTYINTEPNKLAVVSEGYKIKSPEEKTKAEGTAWIPDLSDPGKFRAQFFWPFSGNYWIIYLDEAYEHAIVSTPSKRFLWILSKNPIIPEKKFHYLLNIAKQHKFDTTQIIRTDQSCHKEFSSIREKRLIE